MSWLRAQYIQCQRYILYSDRMQTKELHYKLNNHQFQKTLRKLLKTNNDSSAKIANTHLKWRKWALNVIKYRYLRIMTDIKTSGRNKKTSHIHTYLKWQSSSDRNNDRLCLMVHHNVKWNLIQLCTKNKSQLQHFISISIKQLNFKNHSLRNAHGWWYSELLTQVSTYLK